MICSSQTDDDKKKQETLHTPSYMSYEIINRQSFGSFIHKSCRKVTEERSKKKKKDRNGRCTNSIRSQTSLHDDFTSLANSVVRFQLMIWIIE
jgi:hypothetical protein